MQWGERSSYLESYEHAMGLGGEADGGGTLLDCFQRIFDLEDAALGGAMGCSVSRVRGAEGWEAGRTR